MGHFFLKIAAATTKAHTHEASIVYLILETMQAAIASPVTFLIIGILEIPIHLATSSIKGAKSSVLTHPVKANLTWICQGQMCLKEPQQRELGVEIMQISVLIGNNLENSSPAEEYPALIGTPLWGVPYWGWAISPRGSPYPDNAR